MLSLPPTSTSPPRPKSNLHPLPCGQVCPPLPPPSLSPSLPLSPSTLLSTPAPNLHFKVTLPLLCWHLPSRPYNLYSTIHLFFYFICTCSAVFIADAGLVLACFTVWEHAASTADGLAPLPKPLKATRHYKPGKQGCRMNKKFNMLHRLKERLFLSGF